MAIDDLTRCPFCGKDAFDAIGLKRHLLRGWCEIFNKTDTKHDVEYVLNKRQSGDEQP